MDALSLRSGVIRSIKILSLGQGKAEALERKLGVLSSGFKFEADLITPNYKAHCMRKGVECQTRVTSFLPLASLSLSQSPPEAQLADAITAAKEEWAQAAEDFA